MTRDAVGAFVDTHAEEWLANLHEWLAIPSVSADPARADAVAASASWLAAALSAAGFPTVEVWPTPGHPAVFAHWPSSEEHAPRVLVYGHHDVQPVDPESAWTHPPFTATRVGDELFARGAADDKGQVLMHTLGLAAHLAQRRTRTPAVQLSVLVEGEEEVGSPHFPALLRAHAAELASDVVVVSDTGMYAADVPSVCTGMRGLVYAEVTLSGADGDLHSGMFGGAIPNPATALARVLAGLHDDEHRVRLAGFYDRVVELSERERALVASLPFDEASWLAEVAHARGVAGEAGYSTLERLWARPTAEVHGLLAGYTGPGQKTVIPTTASAKVSFRLVPDQDPAQVADAFRRFVAERVPSGLSAQVEILGDGVRPCLTPLDDPALQATMRALGRATGSAVRITREGGSGPEADLAEILGAPVVFLGVGLPTDRIHAPDERASISQLLTGARAAAYLWEELPGALSLDVASS